VTPVLPSDHVASYCVIDFIDANKKSLRELSLRMVLKIADLRVSFPDKWQAMARVTCMRNA